MIENKEQFIKKYWNMPAMKYYDPGINHPKAQDILVNKNNNYCAMEKRDGEWNMAIITEDRVLMRGRNLTTKGDYKDRAPSLPHLVEELKNFPAGTVLLGEICYLDRTKTSKDVGTIMRCLPEKAIERQKTNKLYFYLFDNLAWGYMPLEQLNFKDRFRKNLIPFCGEHVLKAEARDDIDFMKYAESIWSQGGEGIVIIKKDTVYQPGSRTAWNSLKVKKELENYKVKVIDFIDPTKLYDGLEIDNWKYWIEEGSLSIPVTKPYYYGWKSGIIVDFFGKQVRIASGMTDEYREWLSSEEAKSMLEKGLLEATITGMEKTEDGSIRHPVLITLFY